MITRYGVNFSGCAFSSLLPNYQVDVSPSSSDCDSLLLRGNQFPSSSSTHGQVWLIGTCHDTMGVHVEAHVSSQQPPDLRPGARHLKTPRGFVITTKQNSVSFGVSLIKPRSLSNYGTAPFMQMIINKTCSHCPSRGGMWLVSLFDNIDGHQFEPMFRQCVCDVWMIIFRVHLD